MCIAARKYLLREKTQNFQPMIVSNSKLFACTELDSGMSKPQSVRMKQETNSATAEFRTLRFCPNMAFAVTSQSTAEVIENSKLLDLLS